MVDKSEKVETIRAFASLGFDRLDRATKDLKPEQLDWKSCPEVNTIRWIMTHVNSELHTFVPKILTSNKEYAPRGWPSDYVGNTGYSLDKIMKDYRDGRQS